MDRSSLTEALDRAGVPESWYMIDGERDESMCLMYEHPRWRVFYSERGLRSYEQLFSEEGDACSYLYDAMLRDLRRNGGV